MQPRQRILSDATSPQPGSQLRRLLRRHACLLSRLPKDEVLSIFDYPPCLLSPF